MDSEDFAKQSDRLCHHYVVRIQREQALCQFVQELHLAALKLRYLRLPAHLSREASDD